MGSSPRVKNGLVCQPCRKVFEIHFGSTGERCPFCGRDMTRYVRGSKVAGFTLYVWDNFAGTGKVSRRHG